MARYLRLYAHFLRFTFARSAQFRLDFGFRILMDTLWYGHYLVFFSVLGETTTSLGGWDVHQVRVVTGTLFVVDALPPTVYVSFDIDGLDPRFCPNTGTPVPGGLDLHEASYLLGAVVRSGRQIVGFDLNEVAPGDGDWDGNVGARLLYKMIGWMLKTNV